MASSVALGAVAVPYVMLDQDRTDAIAAYATARAKLAVTFGRDADAPISIRFQGQTLDGKSARATIAHPYYRQSVNLTLSYMIRGAQFGFAARSEEHTSELQSLMRISYAVFCLKKKNKKTTHQSPNY